MLLSIADFFLRKMGVYGMFTGNTEHLGENVEIQAFLEEIPCFLWAATI